MTYLSVSSSPFSGYCPNYGVGLPNIPSIPFAILIILLSCLPTVSADGEAFAYCVQDCKDEGGSAWKCGLICLPSLFIGMNF